MFATCSFLICIFSNGFIQNFKGAGGMVMFLYILFPKSFCGGERKMALEEGGGGVLSSQGSPPLPLYETFSNIQWNPSIFPVGVVCAIGLLSTTWLRFQSFPLLYAGREG